jgi:hypothetical protein
MTRTRRHLAAPALAVAVFITFWSQAVTVPFSQDDYSYLYSARQSHREGRPWSAGLLDVPRDSFQWRPLSFWPYWPLVERVFGGDARAAHALNVALLLLASAAVGWLATLLLRTRWPGATVHGRTLNVAGTRRVPSARVPPVCASGESGRHTPCACYIPDSDAALGGLLAALFYGLHGVHFLSAAWASASNQSLVTLFCTLSLGFWLIACTVAGVNGCLAGVAAVACSVAALLTKEFGAVLPLLQLLLLAWIWPQHKPTLRVWILGLLSLGATGIWWLVRRHLGLAPPPPEYALQLGLNVPRNAISFCLFLLNVPRESLRFLLVQHSLAAGLWALACLGLQLAGCTLLLRGTTARLGWRDYGLAAAFTITGCAPCLLLARNCYAYYLSVALIPYAILLGLAATQARRVAMALLLIVASAAISTAGNHLLPYPGLIGRAHWAQRQLEIVKSLRDAHPEAFRGPVYLDVKDDHTFQGFGVGGLAWRLDQRPEDFVILGPANLTEKRPWVLVVPAEGDVYLAAADE